LNRRIAVCCLLLSVAVLGIAVGANAQPKTEAKPTFASVLNGQLSGAEGEFVPAVEALAADKFSFAPSQGEFKGVRNFGAQAKHVATVNYMIGSAILGEKPPVELGKGEDGPANIQSKDEIVKYLKDSFAYLHKAYDSITPVNVLEPIKAPWGTEKTTRLAMAVIGVGHPFDHYGQIVEYLRMNSIIPPASRQ
jgi:DinB family protein